MKKVNAYNDVSDSLWQARHQRVADFSSPLNDEWLKKCICFCIRGTVNSQKFCQLSVGQLSRGWWGGGVLGSWEL